LFCMHRDPQSKSALVLNAILLKGGLCVGQGQRLRRQYAFNFIYHYTRGMLVALGGPQALECMQGLACMCVCRYILYLAQLQYCQCREWLLRAAWTPT
jgi:hypothetical protein